MSLLSDYAKKAEEKIDETRNLAANQSEEMIRWKPAAEAWSIMEVLCHVEEAIRYWMEELRRVVENPGAPWGRTLQDEGRLAAVARADKISVGQILQELEQTKKVVRQTLAGIKDDDLAIEAPHRNPKFGTRTMQFLLDHFVLEHLDKHIAQINRNLTQWQNR